MIKWAVLLFALTFAAASCVIIVQPNEPTPVPVPKPLSCINENEAPTAHVYFVMRLERSTVNLAHSYTSIMTRTVGALAAASILPTIGVLVRNDERPVEKNGLLAAWGCNLDDPERLPPEQVIEHYAQIALPPAPIGCAADPLVGLGKALTDATTDYPPELNGVSARSVFGQKPDLVLVVHFDERARRTSLEDAACANAHALGVESGDSAPWLQYADGAMPSEKIVHWFFTTDEGVDRETFIAHCKQFEGFPTSVLDIIEPSPNLMWRPLAQEIASSGQHVTTFPLCAAFSDKEMNRFFFAEIPKIANIAGTGVDIDVLGSVLGGMMPTENASPPEG
jgi:hypothetical protein